MHSWRAKFLVKTTLPLQADLRHLIARWAIRKTITLFCIRTCASLVEHSVMLIADIESCRQKVIAYYRKTRCEQA